MNAEDETVDEVLGGSDVLHNYRTVQNRLHAFKKRIIKKDYKPTKELLRMVDVDETDKEMFEGIEEALRIKEDKDRENSCERIYGFLSSTPSFKAMKDEYGEKVVMQFIKSLSLSCFNPDQDVLPYRTENDAFYYIISGTVSVMCPTKIYKAFSNMEEYDKFKTLHSVLWEKQIRPGEDISEIIESLQDPDPLLYSSDSIKYLFCILHTVAILQPKDAFGDLSFSSSKPVSVCFRSSSHTVLAKSERKHYAVIIKDAMTKKTVKFRNVLRNTPFFQKFSQWTIDKLAALIRVQEYVRGQAVFREEDKVDNIYIVKEGEFEELKQAKIYSDLKGTPKILTDEKPKESIRSPLNHLKQGIGKKKMRIRRIYANKVFGEAEIVGNQLIRKTSVLCKSMTGVLYVISKGQIMRAIRRNGLQENVKKYTELASKKLPDVSQFIYLELPRIQRLRKRRESEPMDTEERKRIRKKLEKRRENKLEKIIRRSFPKSNLDFSSQFYDSRVARGELDPPSIQSLLKHKSLPPLRNQSQCDIEEKLSPRIKVVAKNDKEVKKRHHRNSQSTFITSMSPTTLKPAVQSLTELEKEENPRQLPVAGVLSAVATEMVDQYRIMNNGSCNIQRKDIPKVLNAILHGSAYIQRMVKSIKLVQRKCSQKITKSKHNLYRFSTIF